MADDNPLVFISYASPDSARVSTFVEHLLGQSINIWIDHRNIMPGQDWNREIRRALDRATIIVMFISNNSYERRGYLQREMKLALDKRNEMLSDDIYIIPVLLDDDVPVPDDLKPIHNIKASRLDCKSQIANSINHQLLQLGIERKEMQSHSGLMWEKNTIAESWDGIPGYEVSIDLMDFHSDKYPHIREIGDHIRGIMMPHLFTHRHYKLEPNPELYNYGQSPFQRTEVFEAKVSEPVIVGTILSIQYTMMRYSGGTAHPGHWFETFNFVLSPLTLVSPISSILKDEKAALPLVREYLRGSIYKFVQSQKGAYHGDPLKYLQDGIDTGTDTWEKLNKFRFKQDGIEFLFGDYQLWGYAGGLHSTTVPYDVLLPMMKPHYISALQTNRYPR